MKISCPRNLSEQSVGVFLKEASSYDSVELLAIRFDTIGFAEPFGALYLASGLRRIRDHRNSKSLRTEAVITRATPVGDYLSHVGFFRFLGIQIGKHVGEARGSDTYVPIREVERTAFQATVDSDNSIAEELAEIIFDERTEMPAVGMLAYCFKEVLRNVFDHTSENSCFVMAQRWRDGRAEIAIVDEGPGVFSTLSPIFRPVSPLEALALALKPGVTSGSTTENAGFGLYVLSQLGSRKGLFSIVSDNVGLLVGPSGVSTIDAPFQGTAVRLLVDASDCDYFPNEFQRIIEQGEKAAVGASLPTPTSPSKVLSGISPLIENRAKMTSEFGTTLIDLLERTKADAVKWHAKSAEMFYVSFGRGVVEVHRTFDSFHQTEDFSAALTALDGSLIIADANDQKFLGTLFAEARTSALDGKSILASFRSALEEGNPNTEASAEVSNEVEDADIPF